MSVLGPVSNLQPVPAGVILDDLDFSVLDVSEATRALVNCVRPSKAGAFDESGRYRTFEANIPVFGFDTVSKRNGLLLEPGTTNGIVVSAAYPLGFSVGNGMDAAFTLPVEAPDGTMTAYRVLGTKAGQPQSASWAYPAGGRGITLTCYVRAVPGGETLYKVQLRNGTTTTFSSTATLNLITGAVDAGAGLSSRAHRFPNGWWEFAVSVQSTELFSAGNTAQFYAMADGNRDYKGIDLWYHQFEALPFSTSLVIPAAARQSRAANTTGSNIGIVGKFDPKVGWSLVQELSITEIPSGGSAYIGSYTSATHRFYTLFNTALGATTQYAQFSADIVTAPSSSGALPKTVRTGYTILPGVAPIAVNNGVEKVADVMAPSPLPAMATYTFNGFAQTTRGALHRLRSYSGSVDLARLTR